MSRGELINLFAVFVCLNIPILLYCLVSENEICVESNGSLL